MKLISLKLDFCMKELFRNERILKKFLSDVLSISYPAMKSVRLKNTFLWKNHRRGKQGILDVLLEMNDDTKVNIELQIQVVKHWDRRQLFYAGKLLSDDLFVGEEYDKMKKCIMISILDFRLTEGEEYHNVYRLQNTEGEIFSDMLEIHILELGKKLKGDRPEDDWIRLFNAESEEELDMIAKGNSGLLEAVETIKRMSMTNWMKVLYEAKMKERRDRLARDAYVRDEGHAEGYALGHDAGIVTGKAEAILELLEEHGPVSEDLRQAVLAQTDLEILNKWLKNAAKAESIAQWKQLVDWKE